MFEPKVIVEVDGSQHFEKNDDVKRDRYFLERGFRVLRFWSDDVLLNLASVLEAIFAVTHPSPGAPRSATLSLKGRGYSSLAHGR